jgi:hypothetical protein
MEQAFDRLAEARDEDPVLHIEHASCGASAAGGVVWFDFRTPVRRPRSQNDYLEIASQFHTVLLSNVPQMPPRMASEARRFTWLVDVLYDRSRQADPALCRPTRAASEVRAALHRRPAGARVPAHGARHDDVCASSSAISPRSTSA